MYKFEFETPTYTKDVMHFFCSCLFQTSRLLRSLFIVTALFFYLCNAKSVEVAFAGVAYAGDMQASENRYPYSKLFDAQLNGGINSILEKSMEAAKPENFTLVRRIDDLNGRDQAVVVAMVITNETISTEKFGAIYKVLVQLRAQAMFFDFKSKAVLRAYPISFTYIDVLPSSPTTGQLTEFVGSVFRGSAGKMGLIQRFVGTLQRATIPTNVPRFVQVTNVTLSEDARAQFPDQLRGSASDTWIADALSEAISSKLGIPILPYAKGYAIGNVMSMTIGDSTVFNLKLPKPDYEFSADLVKLKKVLYSDQPAGKSFIYGTLAKIQLVEPLSETAYLRTDLKNGEVKVVPATQVSTDDFPAFEDSMRGLFVKLSGAIAGDESAWLKSATDSKDIGLQIKKTGELLKLCK